MASKIIYSVVAVAGIAAAAGGAYWYQNQPTGPKEITGAGGTATASGPPAGGASAPGGAQRGGGMASVEVAKVEASRLQDDAQAVGSLRSKQNVMLRPEVSGRVQSLGFTDGGRVRRGDVIMQLEDGLQRAEVRQAEAQMSIARANFKRNQELVAQNFVAQRVLDESAANVQVAEAQVSLACARWDRMRVVAPFDGTVGIRNVNLGDYVKDGADLVNLEDLTSMFVDFRMPERFIGKIRRDQAIEMQLDAMPGRQFKAKIEAIDPQLDANGRSVLVRAVLPNTPGEPLAQRPGGGPGGQGGGAPGAGGRPAGVGGAPSAVGAMSVAGKPPEKPAAKPAARPPQRPASSPLAAAPRPVDPIAVNCAQFTNAAVVARAAAGAGASGAAAPGGAPSGRGAAGVGGGAGGAAGARLAGGAPSAGSDARAAGAPAGERTAGAPAGARSAGAPAGARGPGGAGGPGAGAGGGPLRPGMFARVTAVFNVKDAALTVPEEAIVPQGGRQFVIRLVEQTEAQGKEIADRQAADAAKAAEAAKAAAAASSAPAGATGAAPAGGGGAGGPGGPGGAQPYNMAGFVDGKRLVSQRQEVKLGIRRPGRVEITEGLAETDTVVVAGQQRLQRDNTPVRVVELGRPPGGAPGGAPSGAQGGAQGGTSSGAPSSPNAAQGSVGGAMPAASAPAPAASR
jgi:membrane fusion protein, multidrug efflux system